MFQFNIQRDLWKQHNDNWWVKKRHSVSERSFRGETCIQTLASFPVISCLCVFVFFTEQLFYLKEVYLASDCSDCLVVHEEIISGTDTFTSLLLFSKKHSLISPKTLNWPLLNTVKRLKPTGADCLRGMGEKIKKAPAARGGAVPNSDIFISRQEKERLTCWCGDVKKTSRMSPDAVAHNDRHKPRWEFKLHTLA